MFFMSLEMFDTNTWGDQGLSPTETKPMTVFFLLNQPETGFRLCFIIFLNKKTNFILNDQ